MQRPVSCDTVLNTSHSVVDIFFGGKGGSNIRSRSFPSVFHQFIAICHAQRTGLVIALPMTAASSLPGPAPAKLASLQGKGAGHSSRKASVLLSLKLISRFLSCLKFPSHLKKVLKLSRNPSFHRLQSRSEENLLVFKRYFIWF